MFCHKHDHWHNNLQPHWRSVLQIYLPNNLKQIHTQQIHCLPVLNCVFLKLSFNTLVANYFFFKDFDHL